MKNQSAGKDRPLAVWKEKDSIDDIEVDTLVFILNGPGCSWAATSGCTMCGYNNDVTGDDISTNDLISQADSALKRYEKEPYVKIFTSGSFLDPKEIPMKAQKEILESIFKVAGKIRVLVESRPEFITQETLDNIKGIPLTLEIAIGLETANDNIRSSLIRKGFRWDQFVKAGNIAISNDILIKVYLLLKPPMLGEKEALDDMVFSIGKIAEVFPGSRISINPMNIQKMTEVESLFTAGLYQPPWLWTLVEVMKRGSKITDGSVHLMSSPTAGGKKRGTHNCGKCDESVLKGIASFSLKNDRIFLDLHCKCQDDIWAGSIISSSLAPMVDHHHIE